jgi:hypothetical protein
MDGSCPSRRNVRQKGSTDGSSGRLADKVAVAGLLARGDCGPARTIADRFGRFGRPGSESSGSQAAAFGKQRQGRWFESTIRPGQRRDFIISDKRESDVVGALQIGALLRVFWFGLLLGAAACTATSAAREHRDEGAVVTAPQGPQAR